MAAVAVDATTRDNIACIVATEEVRRAKLEIFIGSIKHPVGIPTYKTTTAYNAAYYYMV